MEVNITSPRNFIDARLSVGAASSFLMFSVFLLTLVKFFSSIVAKRKSTERKIDNNNIKSKKLLGLHDIDGPPSIDPTGIVGCLYQFLPLSKTFENVLKWAEIYDDIAKVRALGQYWIGFNSAPLVQAVLKSSDVGHLQKSPAIYGQMKPFIVNGVLVSREEQWQHRRKLLMKSQSYQSLKAYMPMLNKHCKKFVISLEDMFKDGKPHQVNELISSSFIKVISEMITGYDNDQSNEYHEYHQHFQVWKESQVQQLLHPWLLLKPIWRLHPMSKKLDHAMDEMFEFARRRIREYKESRGKLEECSLNVNKQNGLAVKPENQQFRSILAELIEAGLDERDVIDEVNTMMLGGHETGAGTIHFFFFSMALNQEIQRECQKEIDEFFEDPANYKDDILTYDAIMSNLKYLERCINETLRLYPPVFMFFRRLETPLQFTRKEKDYLIPAGTNICITPYGVHRRPEYFPDPEKFDPDRFLPEEIAKRHPYSYLPFSNGPRNCLGLKFGMIEMKIITAYTLRHFSITTTDRKEDIPMMPYLTLTPARNYIFEFSKRNV